LQPITTNDGLIVFAHGSRIVEANRAVEIVAQEAAREAGFKLWRAAFLELAEPGLKTAARKLAREGANRIVVTPYFLVMGVHLQTDLPRLMRAAEEAVPGVELISTPPLDGHPALAGIIAERARKAAGL
jgi:sirohydrochlorin ferrochelatase